MFTLPKKDGVIVPVALGVAIIGFRVLWRWTRCFE